MLKTSCSELHGQKDFNEIPFSYKNLSRRTQVKAACGGDLNKVKRVVKLVGFVNSNDDFIMQPKVSSGRVFIMNTISYRKMEQFLQKLS